MQSSISTLQLSFSYNAFSWATALWFSPPSTTVHQHSRWGGGSRDQLKSGNCCSHYQNLELMTSKRLPIFFSRISCYYLCFSGWMNQHNFIKLAICYVSCTPWKAILETNDCKAPHNSRVNSPCCRQPCWGQCHQCWHQEGRDDRAVVTHSICPLRNHLNSDHASARKCPFMQNQTLKEVMLFFLYLTAHFGWASCHLGKVLWLFQQTNTWPLQPVQTTSIRKVNQPEFENIPHLLLLW